MEAFTISLDGMKEVERRITEDFKKGLEREGDDVKVKMLITYVHSLPDGSERGDFLALDLGGSNFRVLLISKSMFNFAKYEHVYICSCYYFPTIRIANKAFSHFVIFSQSSMMVRWNRLTRNWSLTKRQSNRPRSVSLTSLHSVLLNSSRRKNSQRSYLSDLPSPFPFTRPV